jgi:hypothetical protein
MNIEYRKKTYCKEAGRRAVMNINLAISYNK